MTNFRNLVFEAKSLHVMRNGEAVLVTILIAKPQGCRGSVSKTGHMCLFTPRGHMDERATVQHWGWELTSGRTNEHGRHGNVGQPADANASSRQVQRDLCKPPRQRLCGC